MHIQTTSAAIKRFKVLGDENETVQSWSDGHLTDSAFIDAAEQTFCQRHDYPERRKSAHGLRVELPECTCPESDVLEITLAQDALETAIQMNQTSPGWETRLNLETGQFVEVGENGQRLPSVARDAMLVPLPCMDPEGSGREDDRFQEFCADAMPLHLPLYNEYCEETGVDKLGYLEAMERQGWDSAVNDWLDAEAEHLEWLIEQWVDLARTGHYQSGDGLLDGYIADSDWNSDAHEEFSFVPCMITIEVPA